MLLKLIAGLFDSSSFKKKFFSEIFISSQCFLFLSYRVEKRFPVVLIKNLKTAGSSFE